MSNKEDKIAGLFGERLKNWAPEPPQGVWEAVVASQRRRRRIFIYRITAIAATLLLLIGLPFLLNRQPLELPTRQTSENHLNELITLPQDVTAEPITEQLDKKTANTLMPVVKTSKFVSDVAVAHNTVATQSEPSAGANESIDIPASDNTTDIAMAAESQEAVQQAVEEMLEKLRDESAANATDASESERKKPAIALVYNIAPAAITGQNGLFNNILNYRYGPDPFQGNMALETRYFKDVQESRLEAPFSAGLRFSLGVSKRLAFETGLSYTRLNTYTKTYPLDGVHLEYNQSIIYVGVPLGMRYDVLQTRILSIYTAQNVMAEKGLTAINSINKFEKDRNIGKKKLYEDVQGFQLSTTTSAGLGLNVHRYISFYAEGGLQIFYLNHTQPFNIRSSKKLWPVYQSGIRVNL